MSSLTMSTQIQEDYELPDSGQPRVILEVIERPTPPAPEMQTRALRPCTLVTPDGQTLVWTAGEIIPPWAAALARHESDNPE